MTGTSEFWKAWNNLPSRKEIIIECRAYYEGTKIVMTLSGNRDGPWPEGNSIVIDEELYKDISKLYRCRVIDGKLVEAKRQSPGLLQLELADNGIYTSLKNNIIFVADKGDNYKQKEYNVEISSTRKL